VRLVPAQLRLLDAALDSDAALARELGAEVAPGWNSFPGALERTRDAVAADPESVAWGTRLFVAGDPPLLVGWGGFKGPPTKRGEVELGYEIAPGHQGRGLATDAVREMVAEAHAAGEVRSVIAHTLPELNASTRVLEKNGFVHDGEATDGEQGAVWRWRLRR
jgi:[ribosomal protein S5]-alanine N-acetyltransferase